MRNLLKMMVPDGNILSFPRIIYSSHNLALIFFVNSTYLRSVHCLFNLVRNVALVQFNEFQETLLQLHGGPSQDHSISHFVIVNLEYSETGIRGQILLIGQDVQIDKCAFHFSVL